jgi:hypothetical protein
MKRELRAPLLRALLLVTTLAVAVSGCGTSGNTITVPTPVEVTESYSGSVVGQGGVSYQVINAKVGTVTLTMAAIGPDPSVPVGMSIGVLSSIACTAVMDNPAAQVGSQLVGTITSASTLCVKIYDPGTFVADQILTYEIWLKYTK